VNRLLNLSKRERYLIILIAILAAFYLYYSLFLSPILNKIKDEKSKVETYTFQLNNINLVKNTNKTLNVELKNLKEKNEENLNTLPDFERNPEIAYKLKSIADNNKITLNNINFSDPAIYNNSANSSNTQQNNNSSSNEVKSSVTNFPKGSLLNIPVNLRVVGSYDNLLKFVAAIENGDRISIINTIKLDLQTNDTNSTDIIITDITLDYFYINSSTTDKPDYDFNKGTYGKDNLFK